MAKQDGIVSIHGKEYRTVARRVTDFRTKYPPESGWSIEVSVVKLEADYAVLRAEISNPEGRVIATGMARDGAKDSKIHRTSWVEIAETSAVGRALAMFSVETMGDELQIASANEVKNATAERSPSRQKSADEGSHSLKPDVRRRWDLVNTGLKKAHKYFGEELWDYVTEDLVHSKMLGDREDALETLRNVIELTESGGKSRAEAAFDRKTGEVLSVPQETGSRQPDGASEKAPHGGDTSTTELTALQFWKELKKATEFWRVRFTKAQVETAAGNLHQSSFENLRVAERGSLLSSIKEQLQALSEL